MTSIYGHRQRSCALIFGIIAIDFLALPFVSLAAPGTNSVASTPNSTDDRQVQADAEFQSALVAFDSWCEKLSLAARDHAEDLPLVLRVAQCEQMRGQVDAARRRLVDATERVGAASVARAQATLDSELGMNATADPLRKDIEPLWNQACQHFLRSFEIDPSIGAQLASAACRLREGKLRMARQLVEAARGSLHHGAADDAVRAQQLALAQWLELELERAQPHVTLRAPATFRGEVRVSGEVLQPNGSLAVDPGQYLVLVTLEDAASSEHPLSVAPTKQSEIRVEEPRRVLGTPRKVAVWGGGALGVVSGLTAGVMYWTAQSRWKSLEANGCTRSTSFGGGSNCPSTAPGRQVDSYNRALDVFQVAGLASLILATTSVVSYLTAPRSGGLHIGPMTDGTHGAGAALTGSF